MINDIRRLGQKNVDLGSNTLTELYRQREVLEGAERDVLSWE